MGRVAWVALAPVKGLALELVDEVDLTESGPANDRRFFLVDENDRLVNAKGIGVLQQVHATFDEASSTLTFAMPNGKTVSDTIALDGELDAHFWGTPKHARRVVGPWSDAISDLAGKHLQLVMPDGPAPDRLRSGAASLVSTASLRALADELGVDEVDGRRFRMHFGIDDVEPHEEDTWLGKRVQIGEAIVIPQGNVGRCAVTTQNPDTGSPDLDTLKALSRYRGDVETTEPLPFGVHASVAQTGRVRVGDPVALV